MASASFGSDGFGIRSPYASQSQHLAESSVDVHKLSDKAIAAKASFMDAENARQIAQQEHEAVQRALKELQVPEGAGSLVLSSPSSSDITAEEQRLRDHLSALEQARRDAMAREQHQRMLTVEAQRTAVAVREAERDTMVRRAQLEAAEAQREAAAIKLIAADTESQVRVPPPRSPLAQEDGTLPINSSSEHAIMTSPSTANAAEADTLMSMLELHQQLQAAQAKFRAQTRLIFSLQDKLRRQEEALHDAHQAEHRARADNGRHINRRKEDNESRTRAEAKLEKRAQNAERRCVELEAKNEALREQISSERAAKSMAERRAAIAEDDLGPISKGELRRAQYELAEEKRLRREAERSHATVLAAERKAHAALIGEKAASHESRKVSLRIAQRSKSTAMEKLESERQRSQVLEIELTRAHEEKMKATAKARAKASAFVPNVLDRRLGFPADASKQPDHEAAYATALELEVDRLSRPSPPPPTHSASDQVRPSAPPPLQVQRAVASPESYSARRPQASPLKGAGPVIVGTDRAAEELQRAAQYTSSMGAQGNRVQHYIGHADVGSVVSPMDPQQGLFERTTFHARPAPAPSHGKVVRKEAAALRVQLAGSLSRIGGLFKAWDRDASGSVDIPEFRLAVKSLGLEVSEAACDEVYRSYDLDGNGRLDYQEFLLRLLRDNLRSSHGKVLTHFQKWDQDGNGTVSRIEFRKGIQALGFDADPADIDNIFDSIDANKSGQIEFRELHAALGQGSDAGSLSFTMPMQVRQAPNRSPAALLDAQTASYHAWSSGTPSSAASRQQRAEETHRARLAATKSGAICSSYLFSGSAGSLGEKYNDWGRGHRA